MPAEEQVNDRRAGSHERHLDQALSDQSRFVARLSHEMRSPLQAIYGLAEVLSESTNLDDIDRRRLETIGAEANALRRMIDDLLDMSRIGSAAVNGLEEPFAPSALCDEIDLAHRSRAQAKGLDLLVEIAPDVPEIIVGQRHRIRQILANLMSNAIKYTDTGSVTLRIALRGSEAEGSFKPVQFVVQDTGMGIPADQVPYLFEPYRKLHVTDSSLGTGIGLTITRMLTELLGGTIWVTSDPGSTTFVCELMLREGKRDSDHAAVAREAALVSSGGAEASILVVDDSEVNRLLVSAQLTQLGHVPTMVSSGEDAVEMVKSIPFDLVLMDWQMPGMDGLEATQLIRAIGSGIAQPHIVGLAANLMEGGLDRCHQAGMDACLAKPIVLAELGATINQLMPQDEDEAVPSAIESAAIDSLIAQAGDRAEAYKMLVAFLNDVRKWKRLLTDSVAMDNLDEARETAGLVKSKAVVVGATELAEAASQFEAGAFPGNDVQELLERVLRSGVRAHEAFSHHVQMWDQPQAG